MAKEFEGQVVGAKGWVPTDSRSETRRWLRRAAFWGALGFVAYKAGIRALEASWKFPRERGEAAPRQDLQPTWDPSRPLADELRLDGPRPL